MGRRIGSWRLLQNITIHARTTMKVISKIIIISVLVMALTSCSAFAPKPTETPVPTATSLPTLTSTSEPTITPTPTEEPTKTPIPPTKTPIHPTETLSALVLIMPTGKPATNWEGIPVMPNAIAGDGDSKGYSFTIKTTSDEVQKFYEKAMGKLGWNMFAAGQGTTSAILLMFMKGTDLVSISIIPQTDGLMYVLLVK